MRPHRDGNSGSYGLVHGFDEHQRYGCGILKAVSFSRHAAGRRTGTTGVLIVISWPRPTIAQIMQMPLEQLQQYQLPFQ
jgi:hypothetical protein